MLTIITGPSQDVIPAFPTQQGPKKEKTWGSLVARQQGGVAFNAKVAPHRLSTCVLGQIVFTRLLGAQTGPSHQP